MTEKRFMLITVDDGSSPPTLDLFPKPDGLCLKLSRGLMQIARVIDDGDPALVPESIAPMHPSMANQIVEQAQRRFHELKRPAVKSPAEVEELKRNWLADPCWDIESTPGFEAHAAELIEWKLRDEIDDLEAEVASLRAQLIAKRPRLFEFVNGSEVDVDRYIALDATAREHVATFQLHHSYHRVYFDSDEQRASELERMRAFRDGRVS
jgi:hypothetical protein